MPSTAVHHGSVKLIAGAVGLGALLLTVIAVLGPPEVGASTHEGEHSGDHEIWALDQGTGLDRVNVYAPDLEEVTTIELGEHGVETPHMIAFDSQHRYAFIASTRSGDVTVIRTADYEVVDVIETGATAHMAAVVPDDSAVWVANIGARTFTEIAVDLDAETFEVGRELDVTDDPLWQDTFSHIDPPPAPVCHEYTADGQHAYVSLGPGAGGVVVVDLDTVEIVAAFDADTVRANCGLARSADGTKMFANWGSPAQTADEPGEWYVFDTASHELIGEPRSAAGQTTVGVDPHGGRLHPGDGELWQVNRATDDGLVIDPATEEVVDELDFVGETPDILDFSPDGERAYISLRGPNPRSGDPHVATGQTPGFSVIDVETRELVDVVEPAEGDELA